MKTELTMNTYDTDIGLTRDRNPLSLLVDSHTVSGLIRWSYLRGPVSLI